ARTIMASEDLLKKAVAAFNALSPEQQAEMLEEQRQSWVRGNIGLSRDERGMTSPVMPRPAPAAPVEGDGCKRCGGKGEIVVGKGRHGDTIIEDCPSCSTPQDVINLVIAAQAARIKELEADNIQLRKTLEIINNHTLQYTKPVKNNSYTHTYLKNILNKTYAALGEVKP